MINEMQQRLSLSSDDDDALKMNDSGANLPDLSRNRNSYIALSPPGSRGLTYKFAEPTRSESPNVDEIGSVMHKASTSMHKRQAEVNDDVVPHSHAGLGARLTPEAKPDDVDAWLRRRGFSSEYDHLIYFFSSILFEPFYLYSSI
ncbi:unnamed protein product [Protopolystoma xenopodis]|uniref:SAM domain-containing protein n=1 Tax=Protopolystoma xenopodis TaxID=117903 RepID=A0A3S5A9M1_9PLAT|nr:unnamed protein product [Protopolystoma xenopodis]